MKIIVLGDGSVGKTSLLKMYKEKKFSKNHIATIGVDYIATRHKYGEEDD